MNDNGLFDLLGWIVSISRKQSRTGEGTAAEVEQQPDAWVAQLTADDDREGLFQVMQQEEHFTPGLDAAEALVLLGDERGLDHLTKVLNGPSPFLADYARGILARLYKSRPGPGPGPGAATAPEPAATPADLEANRQRALAELQAARLGRVAGLNELTDEHKAGPASDPYRRPPDSDGMPAFQGSEPAFETTRGIDNDGGAPQTPLLPASPSDVWAAYRQKQLALEAEFNNGAPTALDPGEPPTVGTAASVPMDDDRFSSMRRRATKNGAFAGAAGVIIGLLAAGFILEYFVDVAAKATDASGLAFIGMGLVCSPYPLLGVAAGAIAARLVVKHQFTLEDEQSVFRRAMGTAAIVGLVCGVLPYALLWLWASIEWAFLSAH
jgi:hypothetical protein